MALRLLGRRLLHDPDIGQAAEAVRPVEAVADQELVARPEADKIGVERGPPLGRLVQERAYPDAMGVALDPTE